MGLVKCSDCGMMVSDRVDNCPKCGCPSQFFVDINKDSERKNIQSFENKEYPQKNNKVNDRIVFKLANGTISYPRSASEYAHLYGEFVRKSLIAVGNLVARYNRESDLSGIINNVVPYGKKLFDELIDDMIKVMFEKGLIIHKDNFIKVYGEVYDYNYYIKVSQVSNMYNEVVQQKKELMQQELMRKASRGRWQGGGFGVKGAIKGAITASALNAGSDFLHSFGDASRERANNQLIHNSMVSKKYSTGTKKIVCDELGDCVMKAFEYCGKLLKKEGCMSVIETDINNAKITYENVLSIYKDDEHRRNQIKYGEAMISAILDNPGNQIYYEEAMMYLLYYPHDDLLRFLDFWNVRFLFPNCDQNAIDIGKKFDDEFKEKLCVDGQNQLKASWEGYVETRVFCMDFYERYNIYNMPEFAASSILLKDYYNYLSQGNNNLFMTWYGVVEWIPMGISLDKFFFYLQCERESLLTSYLSFIWLKGDDEQELLNIGKNSISEIVKNENVYMCINCSLLNDWSRGLIMTDKEFIDLHNINNRIPLESVLEIYDNDRNHAIIIRNENKKIVLKDGISGIINTFGANVHLIRILHVICVRYAGNSNVWFERMQTPKPQKLIQNNSSSIEVREKKAYESKSRVSDSKKIAIGTVEENMKNTHMFCPYCGKKIQRKAKFCNFCGKKNNYL